MASSQVHDPGSPSRTTTQTTTTANAAAIDDDLDPAAFLASVRELSAKREREDNERFRKLEEEIEKGRQERLARRADFARSISPEKHDSLMARSSQRYSPAPPSRSSSDLTKQSPRTSTTSTLAPMASDTPSSRSSTALEDIPDFAGFGNAKSTSIKEKRTEFPMRTETPARTESSARTETPPRTESPARTETPARTASPARTETPTRTASPTPSSKPSPSAAMPSRSGTLKWQQRPQSRAGAVASRPLSMVAAENSAQARNIAEPSRDQIAAALGARDPSWFRQTADRGIGNAAFRKSSGEVTSPETTAKKGLPGMARDSSISTVSSSPSRDSNQYSRPQSRDGQAQNTSLVESEVSDTTSQTVDSTRSDASIGHHFQARGSRGLDGLSSPVKAEKGGFVQSAMMKRSNSIEKRSVGQYSSAALGRASSIRSGYGGLQGSHSMPKLDQPNDATGGQTDSLVRPLSSMNLADSKASGTNTHHSRSKSITSAYTTNNETATSVPSSPNKRWSPNKSSWIESALTAKADSRPASPTKNAQPSWMSNLAKANAQRANSEHAEHEQTPASTTVGASDMKLVPSKGNVSSSSKPQPLSPKPDAFKMASTEDRTKTEPITDRDSIPSGQSVIVASPATTPELEKKNIMSTISATPHKLDSRTTPVDSTTLSDTTSRPKPQPSPKPQIDFRSTLKPRAATEPKAQEQPEFLSRFGTLRKTATEKYVAPDVLKGNILRGKAGLSLTDGPQKQERRDELKDSLLAKKDQWQQEKQDGIIHERKSSAPPVTPSKPEALVKREVLGRTGTVKAPSHSEKDKPTTPEALRRHQSIRSKPAPVVQSTTIPKQDGNEAAADSSLAARFNSQLAGILVRGPPAAVNKTSKNEQVNIVRPSGAATAAANASETADGQLHDVRKGRAKGPKRRKPGTENSGPDASDSVSQTNHLESPGDRPSQPSKTMAATMTALQQTKPAVSPKPHVIHSDRHTLGWESSRLSGTTKSSARDTPEVKGFSKPIIMDVTSNVNDDKENTNQAAEVAEVATPTKPIQIQLPSRKDEEAAMRSAKLLASSSPLQSPKFNGLGISNGPPKPMKSSRIVSGQLQEASLNKVLIPKLFTSNILPSSPPLSPTNADGRIDARAALTQRPYSAIDGRTIRKALYKVETGSKLNKVSPRDEYVLREDGVYLLKHVQARRNGEITTEIYTWIGNKALPEDMGAIRAATRSAMSDVKAAAMHTICQGYESQDFLSAIGGIMITRTRLSPAIEPYMLCGRKHLGHIVFDGLECQPGNLCSAYVYLIWSPVTITESTVYLWKGDACSAEEVGAARLAAMDISQSGDIKEIDEGVEPSSFWKIFSAWPIREKPSTCPDSLRRKAEAPDRFEVRLFKIQHLEVKQGFFTSILSRRPSWGSRSPVPTEETRYEAKEVSPFTQADINAEGVYLLDSFTRLDILIGPLSRAQAAEAGEAIYLKALRFASDYAELCVSVDERPSRPEVNVLFGGVPKHLPRLFRHWDESNGLWGTAGLMAGSEFQADGVRSIALQDALAAIRERLYGV